MATKMVMPLLGQTMEEGTIIKWFKSEGDKVKAGEPLLEVMTDKVNMEVEAPEDGVLRKILAQPDDIIPVKDPICIIGSASESIDDLLAEGAPAKEEAAPAAQEAAPVQAAPAVVEAPAALEPAPAPMGRVFASPAARRVAREHGIDIAALAGMGTGPGGRIVENDVMDYIASAPKATPLAGRMASDMGIDIGTVTGTGIGGKVTSEDLKPAAAPAPVAALQIGATIPFAGMRKAVAQNVAASAQTAPHVTLTTEVDMTGCIAFRKQILADVEKNCGVRISFTDIIARATARAILDKPILNATLKGDSIVINDHINMGIATAIEAGLVVPVVKDILSKTIPQISKEIKDLVARARAGQAGGEDFRGGTFTITNLGAYGIESFNPIITPGQSAILGVCAIKEKPVVVDGEVKVCSMMNLCLSFDHRVMDGAPAAEFLARLKEILQSPYLMFM
ncbi:MAG: dihydrolipoamide acetyltransferase family protein [Armatimonadota bacterium]|nr:2-oxo acid dehydrogenase subunit E2 [bacterium]